MATTRDDAASIFAVLISQHRTVESLFEQIEALAREGSRDAGELFEVMRQKLLAHAKAEETVVYPRLREIAALADKMAEAVEEHAQVETLLFELAALGPSDPSFLPKLKVLVEDVQHHVEEEEGEIFREARKDVDGHEAEVLADRFLEEIYALTGERETPAEVAAGGKRPGPVGKLLGRR